MSKHTVAVSWSRKGKSFTDNKYSRIHRWEFDGGATIKASASPHIVPEPLSDSSVVDPEEAFVASLSSCHMLWFLSIAAKKGFIIENYEDHAIGIMGEDDQGKLAITKVILHPSVQYATEAYPNERQNDHLHSEAGKKCFIANSVKTDIQVEPTIEIGEIE